jgi:hypothetical protein
MRFFSTRTRHTPTVHWQARLIIAHDAMACSNCDKWDWVRGLPPLLPTGLRHAVCRIVCNVVDGLRKTAVDRVRTRRRDVQAHDTPMMLVSTSGERKPGIIRVARCPSPLGELRRLIHKLDQSCTQAPPSQDHVESRDSPRKALQQPTHCRSRECVSEIWIRVVVPRAIAPMARRSPTPSSASSSMASSFIAARATA